MTTSKNAILVLGGGIYQIPLFERIKARNLKAVVASIPGDCPGIARADEFMPINTTDEQGIVAVARSTHAAAIVTTGTDVALRSLGAAVDALGLAGPTLSMAARASNNADMKRAFFAGGVRTAQFVQAENTTEAIAAWNEPHPENEKTWQPVP